MSPSSGERPPLRLLHAQLNEQKLAIIRGLSTDGIIRSLAAGQEQPLTVRLDGTVMQGNHRIAVLRERGVDVGSLPREPHRV